MALQTPRWRTSYFCDIFILWIILFLFSTPGESLHPREYQYYHGNLEQWSQQLYEEPLYANANESVSVSKPKNIAIIGKLPSRYMSFDETSAGISGASIAHSLSDEYGFPPVTIFEREPRLGGRVHSMQTYKSDVLTSGYTVELGGSTFDADDKIVEALATDVGARLFNIHQDGSPLASVSSWDGREITPCQDSVVEPSFESVWQMLWGHGTSLVFWKEFWRQIWNCESGIDSFLIRWRNAVRKQIYQPSSGPDKESLGEFARSWGISTEPQRGLTWRFDTQRLLQRAIRISGSSLKLNSRVTRITRLPDLTYDVHWTHTDSKDTKRDHAKNFGAVFIAAPFHQASIEIQPPLTVQPKGILYKHLHVTHFASMKLLDPRNFNLDRGNIVPETIWDLRNQSQRRTDAESSTPPFLTLTREERGILQGCLAEDEHLYRVASEEPFTDDNIATLLNKTGVAREDVTFPDQDCFEIRRKLWEEGRFQELDEFEKRYDEAEWLSEEHDMNPVWYQTEAGCVRSNPTVRWIHRAYWPNAVAVPDRNTSDTDDQNEFAPKLFYVSDFERRQGASMSGSLKSAKEAAYSLQANHFWNSVLP